MQENTICPYPGLRPFNEEEAIFFKGREEHIDQIVKQLEEKKFMMLTGASGDGKSFSVYAGLIPNARAGFFKAKFNNWIVSDFRPERDPLMNLAVSINKHLNLGDSKKVEKELSYGFSALIDAYKSSAYSVDQNSEHFQTLSSDEQKKAKRKGANLLILVDQFEEFFTNPENYIHGKSSLESQTVVNLILETTRLAIEQNLPIYIICTMRSDYIGQCASFRGLPEYIGYSQFFVPRLKRKEIYQVIEEPAILNGNRISKRLVEMLINEMNDGIDQLPVLQHALNQIWQKADRGRKEMDLIHFAMINGIPGSLLPEEDKKQFDKWFDNLPEFKKQFFKRSSLGDVLDAHANELYETSNHGIEDLISTKDAKLIVKTTFKCLTKIDESRAVRNRMTLEEVTQIINQPHITIKAVSHILIPYRLQGNTFLKPFISEHASRKELQADTVLDITHESLIRNWDKLDFWANQEHEHLLTWLDFHKQLQRWLKSEKSTGYLLPIGPLTFFDTWFNKVKINKYWLARYDDREVSTAQKLIDAEITLEDTKQFIRRSARRLFFSRTVIKYGADKLIGVFGILLFIFSCTYFYFDFRKKQNNYVVKDLLEMGGELLKSKNVKSRVKAEYILTAERLKPNTYKNLLSKIEGDSSQIEVVREMIASCLYYQEAKKEGEPNNPLLGTLFVEQLRLIDDERVFKSNDLFTRNINNVLGVTYEHTMLERNKVLVNDSGIYKKFCDNTYAAFINLINDNASLKKIDIEQFNRLLQSVEHIVDYDSTRLQAISSLLSPFNEKGKLTFEILYPKDKTVQQNWNNSLTHNAGYYHLANLYALTNDFKNLNRSFDSLLLYNKGFLNTNYGYSYLRFLNDFVITDKLFSENVQEFIAKMSAKRTVQSNFPAEVIMLNNLLFDKTDIGIWDLRSFAKSNNAIGWGLQLQWEKISYKQLNDLAESIIKSFQQNKSLKIDERNYMAAILYKAKAFANNKKENYVPEQIKYNISKAVAIFNQISSEYLKGDINIGEGTDIKTVSRAKVFKFPFFVSLTDRWGPFEMGDWRTRSYKNKSIFIDYISDVITLEDFYFKNDEDAESLNSFLISYYSLTDLSDKDEKIMNLKPFEEALAKNSLHKKIDKDALLAFLTSYYHSTKNTERAMKYSKEINKQELLKKEKINKDDNAYKYYNLAKSLLNYYWEQPFIPSSNEMDGLVSKKESGNFDSAFALLKYFPDAFQKRNALLTNIDSLQRGKKDMVAIVLMDTLLNAFIAKSPKFGNKLFEILGRLSTNFGDAAAMTLMKDKADNIKPACLNFFVSGKAQSLNYYQAITFIPDYISSSSQLSLYTTILKNEVRRRKENKNDGWSVMDKPNDDWTAFPYEQGENDIYYIQEE